MLHKIKSSQNSWTVWSDIIEFVETTQNSENSFRFCMTAPVMTGLR